MTDIPKSALSKVPEVTLIFWIIKILTTTLGETGGDAVSMTLDLGYAVSSLIFLGIFVVAVAVQVTAKSFHAPLYWIVIIATTTLGTTMADFADRSLGVGYAGGSSILFVLLLTSLAVWRWSAGSVSVDTITSPKAETFYWGTILFSQTLGTALGDCMADTIDYEPVTRRVFTFNAHSQDSTVIDARTGKVIGIVPLQGKPEFAAHDGAGHVYVNIENTAEIAEIDAATLQVMHRWPLPGCEEPSGLALDVTQGVLFSGCGNKVLIVLDAKTGKPLATLPIGDRVDGVAFDPGKKLAFSSNGEGTLTVIGGERRKGYRVVQNVKTQRGARTLALDPKKHIVYVVTAEYEPAATDKPGARPTPRPGTFTLLMVAEK